MREIAGPHGRAAVTQPEIDLYRDFAPLEMRGHRSLVIIGNRLTIARCPGAAKADGQAVTVGRFARFAHGHDHASPVRVFSSDGGLHQRGVGDGKPDLARAIVRNRSRNAYRDELLCAFAIAHDKVRKLAAHVLQRGGKGVGAGTVEAGERRIACLAGGKG